MVTLEDLIKIKTDAVKDSLSEQRINDEITTDIRKKMYDKLNDFLDEFSLKASKAYTGFEFVFDAYSFDFRRNYSNQKQVYSYRIRVNAGASPWQTANSLNTAVGVSFIKESDLLRIMKQFQALRVFAEETLIDRLKSDIEDTTKAKIEIEKRRLLYQEVWEQAMEGEENNV